MSDTQGWICSWNDPALLGGLPQGGKRENHWAGVRNLWDLGNYKEMESAALGVFIKGSCDSVLGTFRKFLPGSRRSSLSGESPTPPGRESRNPGSLQMRFQRVYKENFTLQRGWCQFLLEPGLWDLGEFPPTPWICCITRIDLIWGFLLCPVEGRVSSAGIIPSIQRRAHS